MSKRVVITGIGVIASNASGRLDFWKAIKDGVVGYKPITLFDTEKLEVNWGGEIYGFDPSKYLGENGLSSLSRASKLAVCATKLAIRDSQFEVTEENAQEVAIALGSSSAADTNSLINEVSEWHNIKGFNKVLSSEYTASLEAMSNAFDAIRYDDVNVVFSGGVEEMSLDEFVSLHDRQLMSGCKEGEFFIVCPFDKRRNGFAFGEGACFLTMEELNYARNRRAPILGEVVGCGKSSELNNKEGYDPKGNDLKKAIEETLVDAELEVEDIDYICANANSTPEADCIETRVIKEVFKDHAYKVPVTSIKSMTGECLSASGAFAVAASLGAIKQGFIPPTVNYHEKDPECDLDYNMYLPNVVRQAQLNHVMIITFGPEGATCVVIKKYE